MDNIVYEKDYSQTHHEKLPEGILTLTQQYHDALVGSEVLKDYGERLKQIPKVIVEQDKENYEYLLDKLDELAQQRGGRIKGIVSYEDWEAHIYVELPFLEIIEDDARDLLREMTGRAQRITITGLENGWIRLSIGIDYFAEVMDDTQREAILIEEFAKHPELLSVMAQLLREMGRSEEEMAELLELIRQHPVIPPKESEE